jgi:TfoX/Sxy family transcriptional regulator of competence genes
MATDSSFLQYVIEQVGLGSRLGYKRLFGEYALYLDDKVVAFACDNSLYLKPSPAAQQLAPQLPVQPPYPGAKGHPVADELLDDSERLRALLLATAACLPTAKPRKTTIRKQDPS